MVLQSFAAGGNRSYLEFWVITGSPWYPGYITPIESNRQDLDFLLIPTLDISERERRTPAQVKSTL
jgi:hypothetical protein